MPLYREVSKIQRRPFNNSISTVWGVHRAAIPHCLGHNDLRIFFGWAIPFRQSLTHSQLTHIDALSIFTLETDHPESRKTGHKKLKNGTPIKRRRN